MVIKNQLKIYEDSINGDFIITLAIGDDYLMRWEKLSLPYWTLYCKKNGIGLAAMIKPYEDKGKKRYDWQKLLIGKAVQDYGLNAKNICFVDYDIVPNPFVENIFNSIDRLKIGIVSQRKNLPYANIDEILKKIAFFRNLSSNGKYPLDSYLTAKPEIIFKDHGLLPLYDYGCGGLFTLNIELHSELFEQVFYKYSDKSKLVSNIGEEVYLNYFIQNRNDYEWLDYKWHVQWWYEMGWNYPWLYEQGNRIDEQVLNIITSTLMNSNFIHFVGSWEKWAWEKVDRLNTSKYLNILENFERYKLEELKSPSVGIIFPSSEEEVKILSN
jgi:hypothetical protein